MMCLVQAVSFDFEIQFADYFNIRMNEYGPMIQLICLDTGNRFYGMGSVKPVVEIEQVKSELFVTMHNGGVDIIKSGSIYDAGICLYRFSCRWFRPRLSDTYETGMRMADFNKQIDRNSPEFENPLYETGPRCLVKH
ncbi:hypothetical protein BOW51_01680 [Solemya velesiana gill symbiont]|uniref:Uncharacterized protein n=1 Tax=Solemya velesiana gill symbiont TaxID=1918948 RepID=A0A1T2KXG4_9GAMM|nr:hypothetical protein BOW51_01680 [Solemya velesiana gill symbiont]